MILEDKVMYQDQRGTNDPKLLFTTRNKQPMTLTRLNIPTMQLGA